MQHCQPNRFGGAAGYVPPHMPDNCCSARHSALLLVGPRGPGRLSPPVARRLLDRLIAPSAQVEGVDFHLADRALPELACTASAFALVLPPLGNLSNPYFAVHPRRNDRFLRANPSLKALFPEVDFAPMAFTGHVLGALAHTCPERYSLVRSTLVREWMLRMETLLSVLPIHGVLVDTPAPPWLRRPVLPGQQRITLDPDDRAAGALALHAALTTRTA